MKSLVKNPCWETMQCKTHKDCIVRTREEVNCWEIAQMLNGYQAVLNVCLECIVYLHACDSASFTKQEVEQILQTRKNCCNMG